jgi:hypothetical protein
MCDHHSAELNLVEHEPEIRYLVISQNSPGAGWTVSFIPIYGYMVSGVRIQFPGASVPDPPAAENLLKAGMKLPAASGRGIQKIIIKIRSKFKSI